MSEQPRWIDQSNPQVRLFDVDAVDAECEPASDHPHGLSPRMKLSQFFQLYVKPVWLVERNASPATVREYESTIKHWRTLTADPPLESIDDWSTSAFVAGLYRLRGRRTEKASPYTVRKHVKQAQTMLELAGPRTRLQRKAQGLIAEVPYLERPDVDPKTPDDNFTLDEIGAILRAAEAMELPACEGIEPSAWWRALITVAYNTGERRGALMAVEFAHLDGRELKFPRGIRKGRRRTHRIWLNDAALAAVESIRTDRRLVFPFPNWPRSARWFQDVWKKKLLKRAGLPDHRRFGLHGLRKAAASELAKINPLAAQLALGHGDFRTTQQHYINPGILADALARLPQPGS